MDDREQGDDRVLKFTIRNRLKDIYIGNVYLQCMNPFIWIFFGIFLWNGYQFSLPLLLMKEYVLFGFSLARNLLIMAVFFFAIPLLLIVVFAVMKRLKGVVGEHEYTFGPDSFTKNSAKNRLTLSYESVVRFYETGKHYFLIMPNMNGFIIPKRDLAADVREGLKDKLKGTKPVKRLFAHYIVFGLVIAAILSLAAALPMTKYTVITTAMPFRAVWNSDTLYISGGKAVTGQKLKYSEMLGIGAPPVNMAEPPSVVEQRLWVVRDGKIEPYSIQTTMKPLTICLHEGKLYALHIDVKARRQVVSYFTPDAFVEAPDRSPNDILKDCGGALGLSGMREQIKDRPLTAVSLFEWDEAVGRGKTMQIPLGGAMFELGMRAEEATESAGLNPLGDSEMSRVALLGRWTSDQKKELDILYAVTSGIKVVNKETYEQYFGK